MPTELWKKRPLVNHGNIFDWQSDSKNQDCGMEESQHSALCDPPMVARRLEAVRETLGLTRAQIADQLGIDRSSYTKIAKGEKPFLPPAAYKLYELHGVDMNYIYLGQIGGLPSRLSSQVISRLNTDNS